MLDPARRNIGDVYQPVDSLFDFNEGPVVGEVHNFPRSPGADRINLAYERPWVRRELLVTQRHAFLFAIVLQDLHRDFVADIEHLRWMIHTAPRKVSDMKQSVNATEI